MILAEIGECFAEEKPLRAQGLTALGMKLVEEVALGGDWELAFTIMPFEDPCTQQQFGGIPGAVDISVQMT